MKSIDSNNLTPYSIYSDTVSELPEIDNLKFPSKRFILFLAADFNKVKEEEIIQIAKNLINAGLCYICTFGPACEKGHELFDHANILWEQDHQAELHVMSKCHDHEPLEEALSYCLFNALADEFPGMKCSTIIISVGNSEWEKTINTCLANILAFSEKMKPVKRMVIADYKSPYPESVKFEKGEQVKIGEKFDKDSDWANWYWCEGQQGKKAWVPIQYIDIDGDTSTFNTPYDAKELTLYKGEILETLEEISGFTMAINSKGVKGWAPLKNLGSVIE